MSRYILKVLNSLVSIAVLLCLLLCLSYAAFALWDNKQVYQQAGNVQADMIKLKPKTEEDSGPSFEELLAINPDVRAWLTLDNTKIDYPILQGKNNLSYINTNVYGEFALSGSVYMDSNNSPDFSDCYNLLYGHHMEGGYMLGDLDKFKNEKFFNENGKGVLILPEKTYDLTVFASFLIKANDDVIFQPSYWKDSISQPLRVARENQLFIKEDVIAEFENSQRPQILAMTTCSSEFTDARTVVLAYMKPAETK